MKQLSEERIQEMRKVRDGLLGTFGARDAMFKRYEEIYFMTRGEKPKGLKGIDENDIKETISSSGRDAVQGLKRILDSGEVHVKVKGEGGDPDKIEAGLKKMLAVSGEYRISKVDSDLSLSTSLYGPGVLTVDMVDDLLETLKNPEAEGAEPLPKYKNDYVAKQLELIRRKTPFLLDTVNPKQSYPLFGSYGMVGHARKYQLKGAEITDRWGVECDPNKEYEVKDFFYYSDRLVEAEGIREPLMAAEWVARDKEGQMIGSINIPVFTRYAGGTSLFNETDQQSQPLLYAKAKGNWDLRENLYYTYLFTAIYQQGLPGPLLLVDPENGDQDIEVEFRKGIRTITAKGSLQDPQVIDGDVMQLGNILDKNAATQTIQPQTLGQNTNGVTFSQFALASKAGLIPAVDPKESKEQLYTDAFTHILQRIKEESIENDLIKPGDIPESFELQVVIEPDLEQDDLRNAQVAVQILNSGADVSKEWVNSNILKIADSDEMWKQRATEQLRDAMTQAAMNPELLQKYLGQVLNSGKPTPPAGPNGAMPNPAMPPMPAGEMPPGMPNMPGVEQLPQTDAMIPPEERR